MADTEAAIKRVIDRKAADHGAMKREMTNAMRVAIKAERGKTTYTPSMPVRVPSWLAGENA